MSSRPGIEFFFRVRICEEGAVLPAAVYAALFEIGQILEP